MQHQLDKYQLSLSTLFVTALLCLLLTACATGDGNPYSGGDSAAGARASQCKSGDTAVAGASQCLQDDAACYQLANGSWCTGERGSSCPAGSTPVAQGAECPTGTRCFALSESITCAIGFN